MSKKEYLRNRPFLTVEVTHRPAPDVNTKLKGWMSQPGAMRSYEKVSFLDRINNETKYAVVIDILNSTVVRNSSQNSDSEVLATYLSTYKDKVVQAMTVWAEREARTMALAQADEQLAEIKVVAGDGDQVARAHDDG